MSELWKRLTGHKAYIGDCSSDSSNRSWETSSLGQDQELLAIIASGRELFEEQSNGTFSLDLSNPNTAQRLGEEIAKFKNFSTK